MLTKTLAIILMCSTISYAQFILDDCPNEILCLVQPYSTQVTIPVPSGSVSEVNTCDNENNSLMSLRFEAPAYVVSIDAFWGTDENLKMGIVTDCQNENTCIAFESCNGFESGLIAELIPGRSYILYIEGCDNTTPLDVDVNITPFELTELFEYDVEVEFDISCSLNEYSSCANEPLHVVLFFEEKEYWSERDAIWTISYDGPTSGEISTNDLDNILVTLDEVGIYSICFEMVQTNCYTYYGFNNGCREIEIVNSSGIINEYNVCEHDLAAGWIPFEDWQGPTITEAGEYQDSNEECYCQLNQTIVVNEIREKETEIEVELCPQDYPYDFLGEEEFEYSQQNIEEVIFLDEGSLVEDSNGNACDSIIYLILVNDRPQERCSTCNLPLSLEKGKIVFCLPFDDATIDVSGRNTIVRPTGIGYDDNGSTSNDFWEAILDGDEDYITIPHIDDLNTSVFSFNFQFNKDEPFENGNLETIISKGDLSSDNLRFDVSLEKVNESIFDLKGTFYTSTGEVEVTMPDLQIFEWYDIAYVVESDSISLYLDGYIFSKTPIEENLKGNTEDLYIGTLIDNNSRTQFYNGRLDNFKYWKQKLSGHDVLFLHLPEKEFEVDQSYFLSCCDEAVFRDIVIDINNPLDSVIVPNASPTGHDSVYILNYIQADPSPVLNSSLAPQNITVQYQQQCQEFCQTTVNWSADLDNLFTDNCGFVTVSQSHDFEVELDENNSFVEVTITGTDDCGQATNHVFALELECIPSNVIAVPEQNAFEVLSNENCVNENDEICTFSEIQLEFGFIDPMTNEMQPYDNSAEFDALVSLNGVVVPVASTDVSNGLTLDNLSAGTYTICLEEVSNECQTIDNNFCQTFSIRESIILDHGDVSVCRNNIEASLPSTISPELKNLILNNPQETGISITDQDDCGCENTEKISLIINEDVEEDLFIELCEGEVYEGRTEDEVFAIQFVAANGCDSIINIDLSFEPQSLVDVFVEICPDSTYLGFSETGIYEFINTNVAGCDSITVLNLTVLEEMNPQCFVSSINDVDKQIKIYPNPVSNILTIDYENSFVVKIYNVSGAKVDHFKHVNSKIDVSKLESGVYILQLENNSEILAFKRFIKL